LFAKGLSFGQTCWLAEPHTHNKIFNSQSWKRCVFHKSTVKSHGLIGEDTFVYSCRVSKATEHTTFWCQKWTVA